MPAIINNAFRLFQTQNYLESFSETSPDIMYLFLGKASGWSGTSEGEYSGTGSDSSPPTPVDAAVTDYFNHSDMIGIKRINVADMSRVIRRVNWTTATVYVQWDPLQDSIQDLDFYVYTTGNNIYKCISNNGGAASTVMPTGTSTGILTTGDGYSWKYMYTASAARRIKWETINWIPVETLGSDDGSDQWDVQTAAVDGTIDRIGVTAGGSGYTTPVISGITEANPAVVTATGHGITNGTIVHIKDVVGMTEVNDLNFTITYIDANSFSIGVNSTGYTTYGSAGTINPAVSVTDADGSSATGTVTLSAGAVSAVTVSNVGSGYREQAVVTISDVGGSGATAKPFTSPINGHGSDAVTELGGYYVMLYSILAGDIGSGDIPVGDDFRKVGIIRNPEASAAPCTLDNYSGAEVDDDTGQILYVENRTPILRATGQTETVHIIISF